MYADPAYASQQCSKCRHTDRKSRIGQATFACRAFGGAAGGVVDRGLVEAHRGTSSVSSAT
ncbi:zinc ribbon domain-containing protein [Streptomyces sp. NPDC096030]|uniref:zinc ribbon domain-containing protein n=1 Tax=Streptomyces sp. NPDC096030 TaxID=3155423 RepID=UPI0033172530